MIATWICKTTDGVIIAVRAQPRASRNEVVGALGNELKIRVTAAPVDSAANEALVEFIAERLGTSRKNVALTRGVASRSKIFVIYGFSPEQIIGKLSP